VPAAAILGGDSDVEVSVELRWNAVCIPDDGVLDSTRFKRCCNYTSLRVSRVCMPHLILSTKITRDSNLELSLYGPHESTTLLELQEATRNTLGPTPKADISNWVTSPRSPHIS
jgi:hypothetical protein